MDFSEMTAVEKLALEKYFIEKLAAFYKTRKVQEAQCRIKELKSLLPARSRSPDRDNGDEMNLVDFSSDTYSSEAEENSSSEEDGNLSQETSEKSDKIFWWPRDEELYVTDVLECPEPQNVSRLLQLKNSKGQHYCSLCKWSPSNNSTEDFLLHLKTSDHVTKLKNRFLKNNSQDNEKVTTAQQPTQPKQKTENKEIIRKNKEITCNTQNKKATKKQRKKKLQEEIHPESNDKGKDSKNLAQNMAWIEPVTKDVLKCTLCNKLVPKASELRVLMKNLAAHLQSKRHLAKMEKTLKISEAEIDLPEGSSERTKNIQSANPPTAMNAAETNPPNQKNANPSNLKSANPSNQKSAKETNPPNQKSANPSNQKSAKETNPPNQKSANPSNQKNAKETNPPNQKSANPSNQKNAKETNPPNQKNANPSTQKSANPSNQKSAKETNPPNQKSTNPPNQKNAKSVSVHNDNMHCNSDSNGTDIQQNKMLREKKTNQRPEQNPISRFQQTPNNSKKKSEEPSLQTQYHCLLCNQVIVNSEVLKSHIGSKQHKETLMKSDTKKLAKNLVLINMTDCKNCKRQVIGSTYSINEHFSKCNPDK